MTGMRKFSVLPLSLAFLLGGGALCDELRISSASDFIDFSNAVENGNKHEGTTVLLDADIDFDGVSLTPVGSSTSNHFLGTFDGQGHVIKNLKMKSTSQYVGLFGYSAGIIIKNVVMDSSCSVTSISCSGPNIGGFLGYCKSDNGECTIDKCVNMASISINGTTSSGFWAGGIVATIFNSNYEVTVKNCVNYGAVSAYETISGMPYFGGIVGFCSGGVKFTNYKKIQNCANYGALGSSELPLDSFSIGGITSFTISTVISNCLNAGKIMLYSGTEVGGILGSLYSSTNITHCFWTNEAWSEGSNSVSNIVRPNETDSSKVASPTDELAGLNSQATSNGWNKWIALHLNGGRINALEQEELAVAVEPFPDPVKIENTFLYWCTDPECNERYEYKATDMSDVTDLYAHYYANKYTVTFVSDGSVVKSEPLDYGSIIVYPENPVKEGHRFVGWDNTTATVPAYNITITALWIVNNYTITFDFNNSEENEVRSLVFDTPIDYPDEPEKTGYTFGGWSPNPEKVPGEGITITALWIANNYTITFNVNDGDELANPTKEVPFESSYGDLPEATRAGYLFIGWFTDKNESVTSETTLATPGNIILYAHWEKVTSHVEIVFGTKDLTEKRVEEIVQQYTDSVFKIVRFEDDNGEDVRVIIEFTDIEGAGEFVRNVKMMDKSTKDAFKKVSFLSEVGGSFAPLFYPQVISLILPL